MHHIRKFGSMTYVHASVSSLRRKFDHNAQVGYLIDYREDTAEYKVYFQENRTTRFDEDIMFKDRYTAEPGFGKSDWTEIDASYCDVSDSETN